MEYKILEMLWRSGRHTVGIIAYATPNPQNGELWCAAVGFMPQETILGVYVPNDEEDEAQYIAAEGAKLSWIEAAAFFPNLNIKDYKYYPTNEG